MSVDVMHRGQARRSSVSTHINTVRRIMGPNFHGYADLESLLGRRLTQKEKQPLRVVPFSHDRLEGCKDDHLLVACANISFRTLYGLPNGWFFPASDAQFLKHSFCDVPAQAGWYLIRKDELPRSTNKTMAGQRRMLTKVGATMPSACVLSQAIIIHHMVTGAWLFPDPFVRVADVDRDGQNVILGATLEVGIDLGHSVKTPCNDDKHPYLGVAAMYPPS